MREPETLRELKAEILRQLETSETVTIVLTEGDGIHELLASIEDGIVGTEELNRLARRYGATTPFPRSNVESADGGA
jgi:hypothetical protein